MKGSRYVVIATLMNVLSPAPAGLLACTWTDLAPGMGGAYQSPDALADRYVATAGRVL